MFAILMNMCINKKRLCIVCFTESIFFKPARELQLSFMKCIFCNMLLQHIRIYHECEGGIEKSVPRITDWHHEACRVMTNGDPKEQIFLSYPHMNNGFFFLLTNVFLFKNNLPEVPEYSKIQFHMMTSL